MSAKLAKEPPDDKLLAKVSDSRRPNTPAPLVVRMLRVSDDLKHFWLRAQVLVTFLNKRDPLTRILSHYRTLNAAYWSEKGEKAPVSRGEMAHASMLERAL